MLRVGWYEQVLCQKDSHAMTFANGDGWWDVEKAIENVQRGLRQAPGNTLSVSAQVRCGQASYSAVGGADRGQTGNRADRDGGAKDFEVVIIDPVVERGFSDLIEARSLVEVDGVTVRHDQPMEDNGKTFLTNIVDFLGFSEQACSCRDQQLHVIMRVNVVGCLADDRSGKVSVQAIDEN